VLEYRDPWIDCAFLHEQQAERDRWRLRHFRQPRPVSSQHGGFVTLSALQQRRSHDVKTFRRFPKGGPNRRHQLQGLRVVPLLDLRARERKSCRWVAGIELQDRLEAGECEIGFVLERIDLRETELRPDQPGLEPDGLAEKLDALVEPVLLQLYGAKNRVGDRAGLGIGQRLFRLLVRLVQLPLLHQRNRGLERLATVNASGLRTARRNCGQPCNQQGQNAQTRGYARWLLTRTAERLADAGHGVRRRRLTPIIASCWWLYDASERSEASHRSGASRRSGERATV
jgi:hypothetical protein